MPRILIAEDEEFLIMALKDNLESEDYNVDVARDGEEVLKQLKKHKPQIVLLDLLMPQKDGFYVLEEMKKNPEWKLIPVIVLSNLGGDADIKRALALGAEDYFIKSQHPIEEVIDKIKEYSQGKSFVKKESA